ncbi:MAG: molybdopterin molybdotransferase MoeA [Flavobacteriales bacterium]|nr:molybdopterin molybdotransferase MoeA [Flavobacteriales bacterium]MEB2342233.1 molybdopterin molybdotransferase MoeA [Flavobacteriia bacterium]
MITVEEAKVRTMGTARLTAAVKVPLVQAVGHYLARTVTAPHDHPLFNCSAMDGYAFAFTEAPGRLSVVGEVAAGAVFPRALGPGECVRIFTGGMMPDGADTVVMQELVQREGDAITYDDPKLVRGGHVRRKGEQLRARSTAVKAGTLLDAPAIGLLASVGVKEVEVRRRPRVAILVSGDEFAEGDAPQPGKIFGSNGVMLQAALASAGIPAEMRHVADDRGALAAAWQAARAEHDVIICTGGVSVGAYDLVPASLQSLGASIHIHGVLQKPGKPMLFGSWEGRSVFGLPGNPRAVMILFWEYVLPHLRGLQGATHPWMPADRLPLAHGVQLKGKRAEFRAARVEHGRVELLADEGSHMLRSLVEARAIAYFPADRRQFAEGHEVEVHFRD